LSRTGKKQIFLLLATLIGLCQIKPRSLLIPTIGFKMFIYSRLYAILNLSYGKSDPNIFKTLFPHVNSSASLYT